MEEEWTEEWTENLFARNQALDDLADVRQYMDSSQFARLQKTFITATGLNGNIYDGTGIRITEISNAHSPKFCRLVQSVPEGMRRCRQSDARMVTLSITQGETLVCSCHAGLQDCSSPIWFKGHGVGAFVTGQVLVQPLTDQKEEEIARRVSDLGLDRQELLAAIRGIPQISEEKLMATTEFMQMLVDYIVKILAEADLKRKEAEWRSLLRETEMKVIQSKLHPHFLFNILNLISGQALLENATETYHTVNYLSKLLRYVVKSYRPLVSLEEELESLDAYLHLQAKRFEDRFSFRVQVQDEALRAAKLPSLTLQLLVENAIKHGIEPKEGHCKLDLRIELVHRRVVIEIEDGGGGIEPERLVQLNRAEGEFAERLSGIGMIRKRLDYYFAGDFEFHIDSDLGAGTKVRLTFPFCDTETAS